MNIKDKYKYYAVATESSYYVKKGESVKIRKEDLDEVLKTRKYKFPYSENMHWDEDLLSCDILKVTIHYEFI